jgi:hypothetical protein
MKIVSIFGENLFSVFWDDESTDEFDRLFDLWHDVQFLYSFFKYYEKDLKFWGDINK